jgi:hypothetical protein
MDCICCKLYFVGRFYDSGAKSVYANSLQKYAVGSSEKEGVLIPENKA